MTDFFITQSGLDNWHPMSANLPQVRLYPEDWLAIATFDVKDGEVLTISRATVSLIEIAAADTVDACAGAGTNVVSTSYSAGSAVGLFFVSGWSPGMTPWSQSVVASMRLPADPADAPDAVAPIALALGETPRQIVGPAVITAVILNNLANKAIDVSASISASIQPV